MKKVLVTGASGFIGTCFISLNSGYRIVEADLLESRPDSVDYSGVDTVLHLAGLAHQKKRTPDSSFFSVNSDLAFEVAQYAKAAGVKQFVYLSSIKVFGEHSEDGKPFTEESECNPSDGYGRSKLDAEKRLQAIASDSFRIAFMRSSMVYGPGVRANMLSLIKLVDNCYILPLGNIDNKRSMVFSGNLVALLNAVIDQQAGGLFLATDSEPISTSRLVIEISSSLGKRRLIIKIPRLIIRFAEALTPYIARRVLGSFEVDPAASFRRLSFTPPFSFSEGIDSTVAWYCESKRL